MKAQERKATKVAEENQKQGKVDKDEEEGDGDHDDDEEEEDDKGVSETVQILGSSVE